MCKQPFAKLNFSFAHSNPSFMNKTTLLFTALIAISCNLMAQFGFSTKEEVNTLKALTTYIVLDDEPSHYNDMIKASATNDWTFNKVQFITYTELNNQYNDPDKLFLLRHETMYYNCLALIKSEPKGKFTNFNFDDAISFVYLNNLFYEEQYDYKIGLHLLAIQSTLNTIATLDEKKFNFDKAKDYYQGFQDELNSKKLLISTSDLPIKLKDERDLADKKVVKWQEELKKTYKFEGQITTSGEIRKIIEKKDSSYAVLNVAKDGEMLFYSVSEVGTGKILTVGRIASFGNDKEDGFWKMIERLCKK